MIAFFIQLFPCLQVTHERVQFREDTASVTIIPYFTSLNTGEMEYTE